MKNEEKIECEVHLKLLKKFLLPLIELNKTTNQKWQKLLEYSLNANDEVALNM